MKAISFYIVLPFIYLLSLLPFPLLYGMSSGLSFLLYHVFSYRKKVIIENLKRSFPEKSNKEIHKLARNFYSYFCDLLPETFKTLTISRKKMLKHCYLTPAAQDVFTRYANENKSVIIVMGHFGNWEWAGNSFSLTCKHQLYVIYHPLENPYFNQLIIKMRTRFGTRLIAMRETYKDMVKFRDELNATAFIADQTPPPESAYWTTFLHQDTPVFRGTGKIASKVNYPVVYVSVRRTKRGYYAIHAETLHDNPGSLTEDQISEMHTKRLEQDIQQQPEIWLWSHRRWKHKRPVA